MTTSSADAVLDAQGHPLDRIRLVGLTATGHHGVLDHERAAGQVFRADVVLHCDTRAAAREDDLEVTVDYGRVAQAVVAILAGPAVDLVETLAERVAARALAFATVQAVDVTIHKPQAPIPVPFEDVQVIIRRDRVHVPVVPATAVEPFPATPVEPFPAVAEGHEDTPAPEPVAPAAPVPVPIPVGSVAPAALAGAPAEVVPQAVEPSAPQESAAEPEPADEAPARVTDRMDEVPDGFVDVVLALGGNLGDVQQTLRDAVTDLDRIPGLEITEVSPLARSAAVGPGEQPDYLNAVLLARTQLSARALLHACAEVEQRHGRVRGERWAPRTLDIDLVVYGTLTDVADDLELPHPRAHERSFVLEPWSQVDPDALLPGLGGGPVAALAATAPDRADIRWLALDWLTEPAPSTGTIPVQQAAAEPEPYAPPPAEQYAPPAPAPSPAVAAPAFVQPAEQPYVPEAYAPGAEPMPIPSAPPFAPPQTAFAPVEQPPVFAPAPPIPAAPPAPAPEPGGPAFPPADEVFPTRAGEAPPAPVPASEEQTAFPFAPVDTSGARPVAPPADVSGPRAPFAPVAVGPAENPPMPAPEPVEPQAPPVQEPPHQGSTDDR